MWVSSSGEVDLLEKGWGRGWGRGGSGLRPVARRFADFDERVVFLLGQLSLRLSLPGERPLGTRPTGPRR